MADEGMETGGEPRLLFASSKSQFKSSSLGQRSKHLDALLSVPQLASLNIGSKDGCDSIMIPGFGQMSRPLGFVMVSLVGIILVLVRWSTDVSASWQAVALEKLRADFEFEFTKMRHEMTLQQRYYDGELSRLRNTTAIHGRDISAMRSRNRAEINLIRQVIHHNPYADAPVAPPDDMLALELGSVPGLDELGRPGVVLPTIFHQDIGGVRSLKPQDVPDARRTSEVHGNMSSSSDEIIQLIERLTDLERKVTAEQEARAGLEESTLTKLHKFEQHVSNAPFLAAKAATTHFSEAEAKLHQAFDDVQEATGLRINRIEVKLAKDLDAAAETAKQRHRAIQANLEETVDKAGVLAKHLHEKLAEKEAAAQAANTRLDDVESSLFQQLAHALRMEKRLVEQQQAVNATAEGAFQYIGKVSRNMEKTIEATASAANARFSEVATARFEELQRDIWASLKRDYMTVAQVNALEDRLAQQVKALNTTAAALLT